MSKSIRMTSLSTHIGADSSQANPTARAKTPNPSSASLPKVQALKQHESPNQPDSLRARAVLVDRDIHEAGRRRNHARVALDRLERAIARLPQSTGR